MGRAVKRSDEEEGEGEDYEVVVPTVDTGGEPETAQAGDDEVVGLSSVDTSRQRLVVG